MSCSPSSTGSSTCACLDTTVGTPGPKYLLGVITFAGIAYAIAALGLGALMHRAEKTAQHHYAEWSQTKVTALVAAAQKALPKGQVADPVKLKETAQAGLLAEPKLIEESTKALAEARHHAQGGLFPLAVFVAIVSALLSAMFGSLILVKRLKDAGIGGWAALFAHFPTFAAYAFIALLPVILHLAHHEHLTLLAFLKTSTPALIGTGLAGLGAIISVSLAVVPTSRHHADHEHGTSGCCAH